MWWLVAVTTKQSIIEPVSVPGLNINAIIMYLPPGKKGLHQLDHILVVIVSAHLVKVLATTVHRSEALVSLVASK